MDQALALEIMHSGENVLLTGPAGSGKTYVLNRFIREAKGRKKHVAVTATTGLAATHLGGNTIHSWSGIGIHDELRSDFEDHLLKTRREIIRTTDVLIIDEISMLHDYRLDMIDMVARIVREDERPFGGIQVILCGDFFQLPPVNRRDSREGGFVVNASVWEVFNPVICYLQEQHRQDDQTFLDILNALRAGDIRRRHAETLMERIDAPLSEGEVTELHTVNVDVDRINEARLAELDETEQRYQMISTGAENYVESLKRSCLAQEVLTLKKGALVMTVKNSPDKKYVNGSLGIVVDFEPLTNYPIVEFKANGRKHAILPESWELRDGDKKRAGLSQIPLRLAWAITVHKSQGMTLDAATIDLRKAFVEGMGYVALSRVRRLESLSLLGLNRMALRISADALQIDESLRTKADADAKRFAHLKKKADKHFAAKPVEKKDNGWAEKIAKMRETYPNAYRPWTDSDDANLKQQFLLGDNVKKMSNELGRHERSIIMRLQKHFGEDVVAG
jgi:ATP-dependent exoDNAse (exonuclease V) alpha subunit